MMKYIIAIPDGATDTLKAYPDGQTPLATADTPTMDYLADFGKVGWARTVPEHLPPGSDVACLSIFGYNPAEIYTGRAPLEAASMGIDLGNRVAYRCNLVTIQDGRMREFTAGHISTEEAIPLINSLNQSLKREGVEFHPGVQYRHIMTAPIDSGEVECTPPHDILDQEIISFLPKGTSQAKIRSLMEQSIKVFADHPINQKRMAEGKPPATQIWLWGQGISPQLEPYQKRCGLTGAVISAVDLIKGIGTLAGLEIINVPGATGLPDTNYEGKADAAHAALQEKDLVMIHVESTDEMGHKGDEAMKRQCIADFDQRMLKRLFDALLADKTPFRMLVLPDHPTPISLRTHVNEPVPYILYESLDDQRRGEGGYSEISIQKRTDQIIPGYRLLDLLSEKMTLENLVK